MTAPDCGLDTASGGQTRLRSGSRGLKEIVGSRLRRRKLGVFSSGWSDLVGSRLERGELGDFMV